MEENSIWWGPLASIFLRGFLLSLSLVVVVGAQNAFVLRQGLSRNHVGLTIFICAFFDTIFMFSGVYGLNMLINKAPIFQTFLIWTSFFFLLGYGLCRFYSVFYPDIPESYGVSDPGLGESFSLVLGVTLLNPQVYLDTILLVGSVGSKFSFGMKFYFALGAAFASWTWFLLLGYGAYFLRPFFNSLIAWRILDLTMGFVMIALAVELVI